MTLYYTCLKQFPFKHASNKNDNKLTILDVCSWAEGQSWLTCCSKLIFRNFHQNGGFSDQVACVWFVMWAAISGGGKCTYKWMKERGLYSHLWSWFMLIDTVGIHIWCDQSDQSSCLHLRTDDVQSIDLWLFCWIWQNHFFKQKKKSLHSLCLCIGDLSWEY